MDAALVEADAELHALVSEMREVVLQLRREVRQLRCEVGYWKSRHADAVKRNGKLQEELDQANGEIRKLKADLFGKKSEKQRSTDRSNDLDDPGILLGTRPSRFRSRRKRLSRVERLGIDLAASDP